MRSFAAIVVSFIFCLTDPARLAKFYAIEVRAATLANSLNFERHLTRFPTVLKIVHTAEPVL